MNFEDMLIGMRPEKTRTMAVCAPEDGDLLRVISDARRLGLCDSILCGNEKEIKKIAAAESIDISGFKIINTASLLEAAAVSVAQVRSGDADVLMKGMIKTGDIARAILDKENGIRVGSLLSHISVLRLLSNGKTYLITDAAMMPAPNLEQKVEIIKNAVDFAKSFGIKNPNVLVQAAVETESKAMPATGEAAELVRMNQRGEIKGCTVYGPISMDLSISKKSAAKKKYPANVVGDKNILLFHNIEAGNAWLKTLTHLDELTGTDCENFIFGGVLMGATVPVIIPSRGDDYQSKLFSVACACM